MAETTEAGRAALATLWQAAGGDPAALDHVILTGDTGLPSSFRIGSVAQAAIAAAGLAAAALWQARTGRWQTVSVDARHAAIEFRSERYLQVAGAGPASLWDPIAGLYRGGDGRPVRLHTNFPHHRQVVLDLLQCAPTREAVQAALDPWESIAFEQAAMERGGVVAALRTPEEWAGHEQARALRTLPVLTIERIGEASPRPLPTGARPLSGLRVLDLTRIIAGPVAGRALAAYGADVMLISAPGLPFIDWLVKDTGRGKLSAYADLATSAGRADLGRLLDTADVFIDGFRPGATADRGFGPEAAADRRPGIVYVSLSAYGHAGPWAARRGFDSLVQTVSGFNHAEGAAGMDGPKELPCQALDHAAGYLMALGAMAARLRQAREGGSWLVRVSLAQTGRWIWQQGRLDHGFAIPEPSPAEIESFSETGASPFGEIRAIRHAAQLAETPAGWRRPTVPLGSDVPSWP
ncbi:MAG TPA: CoA transferase [Aliidongia sp.]|uniref:CoA transferase n=1 Tax=Aliidongia sp. TaxID=1914230 RepID=UPI002DDCA55E|nr:CoA transferase [Aliidongia sp.]HEV2678111.1 CoA transferase [Aliidongia sp.]